MTEGDLPTFFEQQLDEKANRMAASTVEDPTDRDAFATRPLFARAAKDNAGSIRVLQKCGFGISGEDRGFANARSGEVDEFVLRLEATDESDQG